MRKISADELRIMDLFRKITKVTPTDCFSTEKQLIFTTSPGLAAKAIGKGGRTIKQLRELMKKDIKVIELANDPLTLAQNFIFPLKPKNIYLDEEKKTLFIEFRTSRERRVLLNNQQQGLKTLKAVIKRYFPQIEDIRIP